MKEMYHSPKPNNSGTKIIFDNPILEKLSRTHIAVPISIFLMCSLVLLYVAVFYTSVSLVMIVILYFLGCLFFSLLEYIAHRFLFHMDTNRAWKQKVQYGMHGVHHDYPKDKDRLAMPPPMSIAIASIFFIFFFSLMGTKVFAFLPGMLTGYACYLLIHYLVHAYPMPNNTFKILWVNHAIHHYKDHTRAFGVSSPLWDYVFGTMPIKNNKA